MKEWVFYLVVAWLEVTGESQKTVVLQFQFRTECQSIMSQVRHQLAPITELKIKVADCFPCSAIYPEDKCPGRPKKSPWTVKVLPNKKK